MDNSDEDSDDARPPAKGKGKGKGAKGKGAASKGKVLTKRGAAAGGAKGKGKGKAATTPAKSTVRRTATNASIKSYPEFSLFTGNPYTVLGGEPEGVVYSGALLPWPASLC